MCDWRKVRISPIRKTSAVTTAEDHSAVRARGRIADVNPIAAKHSQAERRDDMPENDMATALSLRFVLVSDQLERGAVQARDRELLALREVDLDHLDARFLERR